MDKGDVRTNFCTLYVVRHGETEWNVKKIIQGHKDSPLTQRGTRQVKRLVKKLSHLSFDAVFTSDLMRAKDTAAMIALERKLAVVTAQALRERNYGRLTGRQRAEFDRTVRPLLKVFGALFDRERNQEFLKRYRIESDQEVASRVLTYLREIALAYGGKRVLIVTHGAVMRTLLVHLGFVTYDQFGFGMIPNTACIILTCDGVDFFIQSVEGI